MLKEGGVELLMPQFQIQENRKKIWAKRLLNRKMLIIFLVLTMTISLFVERFIIPVRYSLDNDITIVVLATGRPNLLNQTLTSIKSEYYSSFDFLVVFDGPQTQELGYVIQDIENGKNSTQNIQWIVTDSQVGELASVDLAFQKVRTPYAFLSSGPWLYANQDFITEALDLIMSDKNVSQVMVTGLDQIWQRNQKNMSDLDSLLLGFNMFPSLHKMKIYQNIEGGFSQLTGNLTYSYSARLAENIISDYYMKNGYKVAILNQTYAKKIRRQGGGYNQLQLKQNFLYQSAWKVKPEDQQICNFMIQVFKSLRKHQARKRFALSQLTRIISIEQQKIDKNYEKYGIAKNIQLGSQFDYLNITESNNFTKIKNIFPKVVNFQQKSFDLKIWREQPQRQIIQIDEFRDPVKRKDLIDIKQIKQAITSDDDTLKLGAYMKKFSFDRQIWKAEYAYYAQKYKIDRIKQQLNICLFVQGKNFFTRSNLLTLISSINEQNYTNYEVVFVSDENDDFSRQKAYYSMNNLNTKIFNRIRAILKNNDLIGTPGNHYMRMKQFCSGNDIVVSLNGNSSLIGRQALNVINAAFQNQEVWLTFFTSIQQDNGKFKFSESLNPKNNLRTLGINTDQYLVAYRYDLTEKLPISHVMELQADLDAGYFKPKFYETESNSFHVYSYAELSGPNRIKVLKQPLYLYRKLDNIGEQCWLEKQQWSKSKSMLKFQLFPLQSLTSPVKLDRKQRVPAHTLQKVGQLYLKYQNCMAQKNKLKYFEDAEQLQFKDMVNRALQKMVAPNYYLSRFALNSLNQIPFCFVVNSEHEDSQKFQSIIQSIQSQKYSNYTIVQVSGIGKQRIEEIKNSIWIKRFRFQLSSHSFSNYLQLLKNTCTQNSLIMFVNEPLKPKVLSELNELHQRQNCWMTYSTTDKFVQINTIYMRVFELILLNDFNATNKLFLQTGDQQIAALAALELCPKFSTLMQFEDIYSPIQNGRISQFHYLRAQRENSKSYYRYTYQYLLNLQQDYPTDLKHLQEMKRLAQQSHKFQSRPVINTYLTKFDFLQAIEYEQLPYLPDNHLLNRRQYEYLDQKFEINKYRTGEYKQKQVRFCFTVIGRNNTQNNRYLKSLKSILLQNYTNYHIVFIDDVSDDNTLQLSMEYLRAAKFPQERVTFIKNKKRTYATYNILNAAFNYCHEDDVQVRFDGDDYLIGKNVLSLVNAEYQRNSQSWLVYTSFKTSQYMYGLSSEIESKQQAMNCQGGRRYLHFIAPLTTWKVKLIRSIPLRYHKLQFGGWLNTLYDDALQFPLMELASIERIKYVPYFTYNYNVDYGSNDNSDKEKIKNRISVFEYVMASDILQPLSSLNDERVNNNQVAQVFIKDKRIIFEQAKF